MKRLRLNYLFSPQPIESYVRQKTLWTRLHIDIPLMMGLCLLALFGLIVLYSATGQDINQILKQSLHLLFAFLGMLLLAQIPPNKYLYWTVPLYVLSVLLLLAVMVVGKNINGARRWLSFGIVQFQPSELAKIAVPMMLAWYYHVKHLPPTLKETLIGILFLAIPVALTAKQPDLGTALLIAFSACIVIFLAGIRLRWIWLILILLAIAAPFVWHHLHDYQQQRVLTFLNPERDPLGSGYHIIQSKIAIGSGGTFGKGWLNGTQSHLNFLPEHSTDFIFAVIGEELGFNGCLILIVIYTFITLRCLYISTCAQDTYSRLLAGSISLTFFISYFINIGMVNGIVPVVGLPLPLVSYGGTSMMTTILCFGMLMSIHTHRKLVTA